MSDARAVDAWDRDHLFRMRARPLETTDGDTFWAMCEHPHWSRGEVSIRIRGFDAPELDEPGGVEARERLARVFGTWRGGRGHWPLRIVSVQRVRVVAETKSFDRYVCDVLVVQPDGSLTDLRELL